MKNPLPQIKLPRYRCHKEVEAFKIGTISPWHLIRGVVALSGDDPTLTALVDSAWMAKHQPEVGGYYVRYKDGYDSYSPAAAFEDGYTRMAWLNWQTTPEPIMGENSER